MDNYDELTNGIIIRLQNLENMTKEVKNNIFRLKQENLEANCEIHFEKPLDVATDEFDEDDAVVEDPFEEKVAFYLENYRSLNEDFNESDINAVLPKKHTQDYKNIMLRLALESVREIKEIKQLMNADMPEYAEQYLDMIQVEERKINYIRNKLVSVEKEEDDIEEEKNTIILVPISLNNNLVDLSSNNIRVIDELEHIPNDYYPVFKELLDSIVDGTFKNVKSLCGSSEFAGIAEVRLKKMNFNVRIIFDRIDMHTYAIISAIVKKCDTGKQYRESLRNKVHSLRMIENNLNDKMQDPDFLADNEKNVEMLYSLLSMDNQKSIERGL